MYQCSQYLFILTLLFCASSCGTMPLPYHKSASLALKDAKEPQSQPVAEQKTVNQPAREPSKAIDGQGESAQQPSNSTHAQIGAAITAASQQPQNEQIDQQLAGGEITEVQAELTANERVQNAIAFLNTGQEQNAKLELEEALIIEPDNRSARKLIRQINLTPEEYFVERYYFEYIVRPDDSLSTISEKFLKDPLKFYILAKYNSLESPAGVVPGRILNIPGKKNKKPAQESKKNSFEQDDTPAIKLKSAEEVSLELAKQYYDSGKYTNAIDVLEKYSHKKNINPDVRDLLVLNYTKYAHQLEEDTDLLEAQTVLETAVSVDPDNNELHSRLAKIKNKRKADRMYQVGLEQYHRGNEEKAFEAFNEVLKLDPDNVLARKRVKTIKPGVIETYHKRAMQHYRKQELAQAIKIWDEVLLLDPDHALAKLYRTKAVDLKSKIEKL